MIVIFFFFQAEDGIRDLTVTGVQTCALPISPFSTLPGATDSSAEVGEASGQTGAFAASRDRKSTRLNSSHSQISYAVFCLKKKRSSGGEEPPRCAIVWRRRGAAARR